MTDTDASKSIDASFFDPAVQDDPFDVYAEMHAKCPVHQLPENGLFMVTKYDDVREMLTDTEVFSSRPSGGAGGVNEAAAAHSKVFADKGFPRQSTLQRTDPPVHTHYRKLLGRVFTNRTVGGMVPRIDEIAHELIDKFIDDGECEFIADFALPLPGIFICEQLGLPASEYQTFKRWADAMLAMSQRALSVDEAVAQAEIELEAQHHMAAEFDKRRAEPTADLISKLVHAHDVDAGEEPLSMGELQDLMHQLITGGFETTTGGLGKAMLLLLQYPDQMQKLRDDPSLQKNFIEESLRFDSPVAGLWRTTACPAQVGGVDIPENSPVMARYAAANRDAEVFENPNEFDITRENASQHVAFGVGHHFCIGAALARAEMMSGFSAILERLDNIELAEPLDDQAHEFSFFLRPMKRLPLKFTKK